LGLDHSSDPSTENLVLAFQSKFRSLQTAARSLALSARLTDEAPAANSDNAVAPGTCSDAEPHLMEQAMKRAANESSCLEITVDMQTLARRLTCADWQKLDRKIAHSEQALIRSSNVLCNISEDLGIRQARQIFLQAMTLRMICPQSQSAAPSTQK
jgi:hypothetical protein